MTHLCQWTALVLLLGADPAPPQSEPAKPSGKPAEVTAYFHDGTIIQRATIQENLEIMTRYGKLSVPVSAIRRVEFGHRVSDDSAQKIEEAIRNLGSEQFPTRESASKTLISLGLQAFPAVEAAAQNADKEVARRAQAVLEKIRENVPEDQLKIKTEDVIHTRDCVLSGRITMSMLKAQTQKFGELQFKLADLKVMYSGSIRNAEVAVEAAPFNNAPDKWLDSGITVEEGMSLSVTASGKVDLTPQQQPGQWTTGPEGFIQGGIVNGNHLAGTLLGRIGEKGELFVIGKRFEAKMNQEGKLYLYIVPIQRGNEPSGSYKVKLTTGHGLKVNPEHNTKQDLPPRAAVYGIPIPAAPPLATPPPPLIAR